MSQVLDLAKQGDADAIAALMNRSLTPQGVKARVILQGTTLQILLESLEVPAQERLCSYIVQGLRKIGTPTIQRLELFGKQSDCEGYAWTENYQVEGDNFTPISAIGSEALPVTPAAAPAQDVSGLDNAAIIKLAKTGQIEAIEAFVKSSLADRDDVVPFVELDGSVLKVIIETKEFLDGQAFCAKFGGKMNALTGGVVKELAVYKRRNAKSLPFLMNQMTLFSKESPTPAVDPERGGTGTTTASSAERPNGQSSAMRYTEPSHTYVSSASLGRPTGVLVVAILYFVFGGFCVVTGGFTLIATLFLRAAMDGAGSNAAAMGMVGFFVFVLAGVWLFLGLARIWIGIGLLHMNTWARNWALRLEGASAMRCFFTMIQGNVIGGVFGIAISVPIFFYLAQAGMSDRFH
jgi:hypothetical protein